MIIEQVKAAVKRYGLLKKGDTVLIGVSGGPDSLALLYILNHLKKELRLKLYIAHLNHRLRRDSGKDQKFVEKTAQKFEIPVICGRINIKQLAKKGSLEEICRNARLSFLFKTAKNVKADKIALGHNLDDQAETVLMRFLRGSGLCGLGGILPKRKFGGWTIIRPMLAIKRREIELFLKRKRIIARIDSSNLEDIYLRNKIRSKLLPFLEKNYNRNIKEVLSNTAESLANDYECLNQTSIKAARRLGANFSLKKFSRLPTAIQRMVLRRKILQLKGNTRAISFKHIQEIEDLILNRPINSLVDLPGNIHVQKNKQSLSFYRKNSPHRVTASGINS